jgi:hypothetical protein
MLGHNVFGQLGDASTDASDTSVELQLASGPSLSVDLNALRGLDDHEPVAGERHLHRFT